MRISDGNHNITASPAVTELTLALALGTTQGIRVFST